ncbi:Hsp70 family protein [Streptomyces sp. NPDC021969]|uniref:Hsp70 family protein n=1 Tax=unclassified Streptomyces TaxID=2593676 RepID=UPI0033D71F86
MMRETVDFGIDLGTTTSAIAVAENGSVRVIKNVHDWDVTPSAVWMPKPGEVHVGGKAKQRVESDPANAHAEFKLEMGVAGAERHFAKAGVSLTPEQLSAEVLKSLRADAASHCGEPPGAAVITVPAAFALHQSSATGRAAELAGLGTQCPLVQEPTAAAIAYGYQDASDRAYWLVFDFGGGTFDAAIVSKRDGDLQVLNHAGDPHLGGKVIDWALVERLLVPAIVRDLGLADFTRDNKRWTANFAKLKWAAESAKIELSRRESASVDVELDTGSGGTELFEYTLTRGALEDIATPYYTRAVNRCRDALTEGSLRPDDIDRLLLVGGATLAPGLREHLADPRHGLGIEVDHSQDATTVVARGAAVFAGTVRVKDRVPRPAKAGEFTVDLHYEPRVTTTNPPVGGVLHSVEDVDWTRYSVVLANPQGKPPFLSPKVAVRPDGKFVTDVSIDAHAASTFTVQLTDADGVAQRLSPDTLTFTHSDLETPGEVLTQSLGIGTADGGFDAVLRKGTQLPTRNTQVFRTSIPLSHSAPDAVIRIPVAEGEQSRAERNHSVGELVIRRRDVTIDLPAGSEVVVTFEADASRRITVIADVSLVDTQFEAEVDLSGVRPPEQVVLEQRLGGVRQRLAELQIRVAQAGSPAAGARLSKLDDEEVLPEVERLAARADSDIGAASAAESLLLYLEKELDSAEKELDQPGDEQELLELLRMCTLLVTESGNAELRAELADLRAQADEALAGGDPAALERAKEGVAQLYVALLQATGQLEAVQFRSLRAVRHEMSSRDQADSLLARGERALPANDRATLADVNAALLQLLPVNTQVQIGGLTKG